MSEHKWMQGIVIGGPANGLIIQQLLVDAETIELSRPDYIKPLAYSKQDQPDVAKIRDTYQVCTIWLDAGGPDPVPFGLVVVDGMPMVDAFSELVKGFAQHVITQLSAEKLSQ